MGKKADRLLACGAAVVREGPEGPEVLVVHRPRYDDWSLPKGKLLPDEDAQAGAVREVREETGLTIRLSRPLGHTDYGVEGHEKRVRWWLGTVVTGELFTGGTPPRKNGTQEVDRCAWWPLPKARRKLTHASEAELLASAEALVPGHTVLLVRHAKAMLRKHWIGQDAKRPLAKRGRRQADRLRALLGAYGVTQLVSSSSTRCLQTFQPYAECSGVDLVGLDALSEEAYDENAAASQEVMEGLLAQARAHPEAPMAICGHRPLLPMMRAAMGVEESPMRVAEALIVHHDAQGGLLATEVVKSAF